ncbi:MAG: twin-arginine translocase TatA/TatE family subunit [Phycisphaeraceae bacterium]|nr:twin-arginine translocase TatA/TatE family subunit [Phycisphaeraceae bacterium]MCW5753893.1 twin-arginine translocase TatA/TatE family subunit [Phycisphaeraceae bacterium]
MFAFIQNIGPTQWIIILVLALLLFGKRLPEVGRSLGRGIVEFKKGIKGIDDEIESEAAQSKSKHSPKPPLTAEGEDARVSRSTKVEEQASNGPAGA